ncbi:inhibitory synaptic factor 1 isoform X2 [Erythrolamprus reginae]|uniref:inhibitory synaptic factor 1 isoform X2 n=1 Tax=Erythrolamprus reginae TaxID=121349 RepID=UPI00396CF241
MVEQKVVVSQIDNLTSDFEFEMEPDDWTTTTVSSTSSSEKGGGLFDLGNLDFMTSDILSDSWEFCSFLEASTPSDSGDGSEQQLTQPQQPLGHPPDYQLMNGGVLMYNGPQIETPDSSSEEAFSSLPSHKPRTPGTRERVRFSDKVLYHALCCDDDEEADSGPLADDPPEEPSEATPKGALVAKTALRRSPHLGSGPLRKLTRNSSTQTVSDKSTQTILPYVSNKQKVNQKN